MSNLQESIRNLGTKVNGVEPEGILVKDILKSFGETFTGQTITSNKVFEIIDEIADKYTPPTPPTPSTLTPIEVNDVFVNGNKIYFDTSVNVEEMFASVESEALLIQGKIYNGDTEISNSQMMMVASDGNGGFIIGFCKDGDTPVFVYSTSANPELELSAGWQNLDADDSLTIDFYSQSITSLKITNVSALEGWNGVIVGTK